MILAALTAGVMIGAALAVRAVGDAILADLEDQLDTTRERVIADLRRPSEVGVSVGTFGDPDQWIQGE